MWRKRHHHDRGLKPPRGEGPLRGKSQEVQTRLQDGGAGKVACEAVEEWQAQEPQTRQSLANLSFGTAFLSHPESPHGSDCVQRVLSAQGALVTASHKKTEAETRGRPVAHTPLSSERKVPPPRAWGPSPPQLPLTAGGGDMVTPHHGGRGAGIRSTLTVRSRGPKGTGWGGPALPACSAWAQPSALREHVLTWASSRFHLAVHLWQAPDFLCPPTAHSLPEAAGLQLTHGAHTPVHVPAASPASATHRHGCPERPAGPCP